MGGAVQLVERPHLRRGGGGERQRVRLIGAVPAARQQRGKVGRGLGKITGDVVGETGAVLRRVAERVHSVFVGDVGQRPAHVDGNSVLVEHLRLQLGRQIV